MSDLSVNKKSRESLVQAFLAFVEVVEKLRGPNGCPWDKEQTHATLTQYAIEEAHELAEAIDQGDTPHIREELGDLLLQVVLHSEIARQDRSFQLEDVIRGVSDKMIRRHPHVFGNTQVSGSDEVMKNWNQIKQQEKADTLANSTKASPFGNIPLSIPALIRSQKIGAKTVRMNFDWERPEQVLEKVEEELGELKEAMSEKSLEEQQMELGDLLFATVQLARHLNFDAEQALRMTNKKFELRFAKMRELVELDHKDFGKLPPAELEIYWKKAKKFE